ncbi:MAG: type IV toxin-antitoxin system AbiEi family antitoxin domain-containing protein [Solirubrobacterales bacterium]
MRSLAPLADLAEVQYGVVTYRQMRNLGLSNGHIHRASKASRLRRVHRGVYAVGHKRLSRHGHCLAAVLACGEGAVLSHRSAAWLWGFLPGFPFEAEVTVPSRGHRRCGIRIYRTAGVPDRDCTTLEGIPVTSAARTLFDLAGSVSARDRSRAVDRAKRTGKLDLAELDAILARRSRMPQARLLRQALILYRKPVFDRARSELLFLDALEKEHLPLPKINCWVEKWEIDAYWEAERFAVEVDGWESHGSREAFERDRLRQEEMKLAGIDCIRISARRIEMEPERVAQNLRVFLSRRRPAQ